jgi:phosphomevalonate kinase
MSPPRCLRAPGKLVLMGEYAVLDGAPAIVLAVNRGVAVRVEAAAGLHIETPDGDDRFVRGALAGQRGAFRFSAWNPVEGIAGKPGFGGSAAACVVACLAAGRPVEEAYALHFAAQGSGSGVDVAASAHGGMLRFVRPSAPCAAPTLRSLPPLRPVVVWSGQSARTGPRVANYQTWGGRADFADESTALVDSFIEQPIQAMRAARRALEAMAEDAGLAYRCPGIDRAIALAEDLGGAAKASGAGGGDCAVAILPDAEAEAAYLSALQNNGLQVISIEIAGPPGPC